jgi:hypothetical protein
VPDVSGPGGSAAGSGPVGVVPLPPATAGPAPVSDATLSTTSGTSGGPSIGLILSVVLLMFGGVLISATFVARR